MLLNLPPFGAQLIQLYQRLAGPDGLVPRSAMTPSVLAAEGELLHHVIIIDVQTPGFLRLRYGGQKSGAPHGLDMSTGLNLLDRFDVNGRHFFSQLFVVATAAKCGSRILRSALDRSAGPLISSTYLPLAGDDGRLDFAIGVTEPVAEDESLADYVLDSKGAAVLAVDWIDLGFGVPGAVQRAGDLECMVEA